MINILQISKCGIYLHQSGMIGASPDGIIQNGENCTVVEIKCPATLSTTSTQKELEKFKASDKVTTTLKNVPNMPYLKASTTSVVMNKNHPYYSQLQCQLHLTGTTLTAYI